MRDEYAVQCRVDAALPVGLVRCQRLGRAGGARPDAAWGWAWTALGAGAVLGPLATLRLRALRESAQMAGGKR